MEQSKAIDPKAASPDDLTKTTSSSNVELSEQELRKASGGAATKLENNIEIDSYSFGGGSQ